jgi:Ni/Co efflux regulator RcnB
MSSKLALRVATLAIGTAAFAAVPALAQNQNPQMESKRQAAAERNHLRGTEKWDHGKKYYDYAGTMPPAPTQQEMQSKQEAAAQRRSLRGVTKWDHGKKYTDYMPEGQSGNM